MDDEHRNDADNRFGRTSELRLKATVRDGVTAVPELYASMPFKVMHAFDVRERDLPGYMRLAGKDDGRSKLAAPKQLMVMSVSAGIMAGDRQELAVDVESGAALSMTTQAFEKIHRMEDGEHATRTTRIHVGANAYLDYQPLPQIPFAGSSFSTNTTIELADASSHVAYEEILSCGRVARGERFAYRDYRSHVRVTCAGTPVFIDNTIYRPNSTDMDGFGFYGAYSHLANLILVNLDIDDARFATIRDYLQSQTGEIGASAATPTSDAPAEDDIAGGITRLATGGCLVKLLGHRAQRLQDVLNKVRDLV